MRWSWAVAVLGLVAGAHQTMAAGDPTAGEQIFHKCAICHSPLKGTNKVGPSLFGIVGRKSATIDTFTYSDAMKAANKTWDEATLNIYLTDPKALVPGTKMIFPGLKDDTDRANVIAYLATLK